MSNTRNLTVSITNDLYDRLDKQLEITRMSRSRFVETAIITYLILDKFAPNKSNALAELIPDNQTRWVEFDKLLDKVNDGGGNS
jgi:metal-responsive CopG/Arc/MetJ family transcriptional regulator